MTKDTSNLVFDSRMMEHKNYWLQKLQGLAEPCFLETDHRQSDVCVLNTCYQLSMAADTRTLLNKITNDGPFLMFTCLTSAMNIYLWKYGLGDSVSLGTPPRGADSPANTVVIRADLDSDMSFRQLLMQCRQTLLDAQQHQNYPQARLARDWFGSDAKQLVGIILTSPQLHGALNHDGHQIELEFKHDDKQVLCEFRYSSKLFQQKTIERLGTDLMRILHVCLSNPDVKLGDISLLSRSEIRDMIENATSGLEEGIDGDLLTALKESFICNKNCLAVKDSEHVLSYAQLDERSNAIAAFLYSKAPVAILMERSVDMIATLIGVLKAGTCYVPLSSEQPAERLSFMLEQSGASVLCVDQTNLEVARTLNSKQLQIVLIDDKIPMPDSVLTISRDVHGNDLAYIIFTSGSTGQPKGVMIEDRSVLNLCNALNELIYSDLGSNLNVALMASTVFDASVQQIFPALLSGHTLCLIDEEIRRDGEHLCDRLRDWKIDICDCTPSLLTLMQHGGLVHKCGHTMKHILVGGEPLPGDLVGDIFADPESAGFALTNVYGPTECCVDVTAFQIQADVLPSSPVVPIGQSLKNCQTFIIDRQGFPVPSGVPGELLIAGSCLSRGYINDPKLTAERFKSYDIFDLPRAYRSGDICRINNGVIEYLGRNDDQIKILGHRIEPGEIETHLRRHPRVREVTVQACVTSKGYKEMAVYLVTNGEITISELRDFALQHMPEYMVPGYFITLDSIPVNSSGKVDRHALPDPETAAQLSSGIEYQPPSTAAEIMLCEIWARALRLDRVGIDDNYFALGGDSIKALQLATRVRAAGWSFEIRDIFQYPSIRQLACLLEPTSEKSNTTKVEGFSGTSELSAVQRFFFEAYGEASQFNQAVLLKTTQTVDPKHLQTVLNGLVAEHEMLRCRFVGTGKTLLQNIAEVTAIRAKLEQVNLQSSPDPAAELKIHSADVQARFKLDQAPLCSMVLYALPGDEQRLLLSAHHLIVDGVSWRILIEALDAGLAQLQSGRELSFAAKTATFPQWVEAQINATEQLISDELSYWTNLTVDGSKIDRNSTLANREDKSIKLSQTLTSALLTDAHKAYNTEINDLLVCAVVRALCSWSGRDNYALTMEGHGRESIDKAIDVSQTVGWFTSMFPVSFNLAEKLADNIKMVKETLRTVPNKGIGYNILRYVSQADGLPELPETAFNYLGQFDSEQGSNFSPAPETLPPTASRDLPMLWPLEITAAVVEQYMTFTIAYNRTHFSKSEIDRLCSMIQEQLEQVVSHTSSCEGSEVTASDLDYDGFNQEGFDSFLDSL